MKIGELARRTGKTVRALHLYEEMGLLMPARSDGGFRLYGESEFKRVTWIKTLQDMGFRLAQIRGLLESVSDSASAPQAMESVRQLFQERLLETRRQVEVLLKLERDIAESMAYLEACRSCDETSSGACANCDQERHGIPEPALVAGIHLGKSGHPRSEGPQLGHAHGQAQQARARVGGDAAAEHPQQPPGAPRTSTPSAQLSHGLGPTGMLHTVIPHHEPTGRGLSHQPPHPVNTGVTYGPGAFDSSAASPSRARSSAEGAVMPVGAPEAHAHAAPPHQSHPSHPPHQSHPTHPPHPHPAHPPHPSLTVDDGTYDGRSR